MSILHYFSKDVNKRAKYIFNLIAPMYTKVDHNLAEGYQLALDAVEREIGSLPESVLDIGTGTGAWANAFLQRGVKEVHGVDFAEKMLEAGRKKHPEITFSYGDAEDLKDIPDQSFDVVTASFVLHGVKSGRRVNMLKEMNRIARNHVIIHDFVGKTPAGIRFLEFMERSDYKHFKVHFCEELKRIFPKTKRIAVEKGSGVYIGWKKGE